MRRGIRRVAKLALVLLLGLSVLSCPVPMVEAAPDDEPDATSACGCEPSPEERARRAELQARIEALKKGVAALQAKVDARRAARQARIAQCNQWCVEAKAQLDTLEPPPRLVVLDGNDTLVGDFVDISSLPDKWKVYVREAGVLLWLDVGRQTGWSGSMDVRNDTDAVVYHTGPDCTGPAYTKEKGSFSVGPQLAIGFDPATGKTVYRPIHATEAESVMVQSRSQASELSCKAIEPTAIQGYAVEAVTLPFALPLPAYLSITVM